MAIRQKSVSFLKKEPFLDEAGLFEITKVSDTEGKFGKQTDLFVVALDEEIAGQEFKISCFPANLNQLIEANDNDELWLGMKISVKSQKVVNICGKEGLKWIISPVIEESVSNG